MSGYQKLVKSIEALEEYISTLIPLKKAPESPKATMNINTEVFISAADAIKKANNASQTPNFYKKTDDSTLIDLKTRYAIAILKYGVIAGVPVLAVLRNIVPEIHTNELLQHISEEGKEITASIKPTLGG